MKSNIAKALLGAATLITAATVLNKVLKETNFNDILKDITIDLDAFTPKEEKIVNPNGEDYTVKPDYVRVEEKIYDNDVSTVRQASKSAS